MNHLIVVAGHAILRDIHLVEEDAGWFLQDFQKGEPKKYIGHIERAVQEAASYPESMLLFSGGPTRIEAGPRTEALSYWLVAEHFHWFGHPEVKPRAYLEDFARDSFENLLFGICRFKEVTGALPDEVTVVSWEFKRERFADLHREAMNWPAEKFRYIGANNPDAIDQALHAEQQARRKYLADPHSTGEEFRLKKDQRNPFRRQNGYLLSCPEMFTVDKAPIAGV